LSFPQTAAFGGAKRPFIKSSRSNEAKLYSYLNNIGVRGLILRAICVQNSEQPFRAASA
jgi:hypothetical protein